MEKCGKIGKMSKKVEKWGKMMKHEEKPGTGSRQGKERAGKERQQGTPSRNRKPETGNSGFWIRNRDLVSILVWTLSGTVSGS